MSKTIEAIVIEGAILPVVVIRAWLNTQSLVKKGLYNETLTTEKEKLNNRLKTFKPTFELGFV